ncbi:MAG: type II toxin-antitoxin system RelE/ParE family toxin [Nitrospirota bacterium]
MKIIFTKPFVRDYRNLPSNIQRLVDRQIERLIENPKHPSLQTKKIEGHKSILEARVTLQYRVTFQIAGDTYILRRVGTHSVLKRP